MRLVCLACLILLTACGGGSGLVYGDHDPYDWGRRAPNDYEVHGLDVSRWQGDVDWRAVARAGVAFTFIKATEGGDHTDPMFKAHWTG
ncbi:MAG: GH25 family lysozyme, partial [Pseudomonadota bacterium]